MHARNNTGVTPCTSSERHHPDHPFVRQVEEGRSWIFGLLHFFEHRKSEYRVFKEQLDTLRAAEDMGFDYTFFRDPGGVIEGQDHNRVPKRSRFDVEAIAARISVGEGTKPYSVK
jgi:hypothetical protein